MLKKLGAGIAAITTAVAAAALGISYYMGGKLQQELSAQLNPLQWQGLQIQLDRYERGLFISTAHTVWTVDAAQLHPDEDDEDADGEAEPITFSATHQITHGPLPWGHAAQIHTRFALSSDAEPALAAALQGKSSLEITSQLGWRGGSSHAMHSPAFSAQLQDGQMSWGGLKARWQAAPGFQAIKGHAELPLLDLLDEEARIRLDKTRVNFDLQQPQGHQFWVGPLTLKLDKLSVQESDEASPSAAELIGVRLDSNATLQADLLKMTFKSTVQNAVLGSQKAQDLELEMALRNIDSTWADQVIRMSRQSQQVGGQSLDSSDLRHQLMRSLNQALARQPAIDIQRLALRNESGLSEFSASVAYVGEGQGMSSLFQNLQLHLQAALPAPTLESLMLSRKRRSLLSSLDEDEDPTQPDAGLEEAAQTLTQNSLDSLQQQGILLKDGGQLKMQLSYARGLIQVNGKPLDQMGIATLMGELLE